MKTVIRSLTATLRTSFLSSGSVRRRRTAPILRSSVLIDVLEARLLLAADLGDAPDPSSGTGVENYQTLAANGGPRHTIDQTQTTLFLGAGVDGDTAAQQSMGAQGDDLFAAGGRDDEDGVLNPLDLQATVGTNPVVAIQATNKTNQPATLYGWIDLNRNGVFENATERTQVTVAAGSDDQRFTLTFPLATAGAIGKTYARFRLSSDAASANSTGPASDGEVEDYRFTIQNRIAMPLSTVDTITLGEQIYDPPNNWPMTLLGFDIAPIGDLDRNGVQDFVVTDPMEGGVMQEGGPKGAAFIVFRNADGTVKQTVRIANNHNGGPALNSDDMFGSGVTSLGDIDGDGVTDLAIGAPGDGTGGMERGAVYIVRLKADGKVKSLTKIANGINGGPILHDGDGFGMSVTSPGDMDGDGIADLVAAALDADVDGEDRGVIYTMFLNADGTVRTSQKIENTSLWNPTVDEEENFGARITSIGDINSDGVADLASLSASYVDFGDGLESIPKQIDILLMNANGTLKQFVGIGDELNGGPNLANNDAIWDLTPVGDADGDGVEDLAVMIGDATGEQSSRLQIISLTPEGHAKSVQQTSLSYTSYLSSITNLGDTNNDGRMELAWGMPLDGGFFSPRGVVQVRTLENATVRTAKPAAPVIDRTVSRTKSLRPQISWNDVADETSYEVWIRNEDSGVVVVSSAIVATNSYIPTSDLIHGNYSISVRARNEAGASAWSARYRLAVVRVAQINPIATSMNTRPEISWDKLGENSRYDVWISRAATPERDLIRGTTGVGVTHFVPPISMGSGNYRVQVREVTVDNPYGIWSDPREFTLAANTEITRISAQMTNRPSIEWQPLPGATNFEVWISSLDQPTRPVMRITTPTAVTSYRPPALPAGRYQVWVRGVAANDATGEWSRGVIFRSLLVPELTTGVNQLTAGARVNFSWTFGEDAQAYDIWIDDPGNGLSPASTIVRTLSRTSSIDLPKLGKYRIWVRAVNADGVVGLWSAPLVLNVDAKPVGLIFNSSDVAHPEFRWQSVPGADVYEIRVTSTETNTVVAIEREKSTATPSAKHKLIDQLPIGSYQVSVRAIAPDRTDGSWSESIAYNSLLAPRLATVQPGLESDVTLAWTAAANSGPIRFSIMDTVSMKIIHTGTAANGRTSAVATLAEGRYRWWAMSTSHGMWSLPGEFVVKRGTVFTNESSFQTNTSVTLTWEEVNPADHYEVWVTDQRGLLVYRNDAVSGQQITLPNTLLPGHYRAWVRAISSSSVVGRWSSRLDFVVQPIT